MSTSSVSTSRRPAAFSRLAEGDAGPARRLAAWKRRLAGAWEGVRVLDVNAPMADATGGDGAPGAGPRSPRGLGPEDVAVQLYDGPVDSQGHITGGTAVDMSLAVTGGESAGPSGAAPDGVYLYTGTIPSSSALHGYSIRIMPRHPDLPHPFQPGLITWAS